MAFACTLSPMTGRVGRCLLVAVAVTLGVLLGPAEPARAQDLPRLEGPVTDLVDAVGDETPIVDAIDRLRRDHDVQLFVLYVESTADETATRFAELTAQDNSLGGNDALLLIALGDRSYAMWVADGLDEVSDAEIDALLVDDVEPRLVDGDPAGAAVAAADALGEAVSGNVPVGPTSQPVPTPRPEPGPQPVGGGSGLLIALVVILVGVIVVAVGIRGWFLGRREAEERDRRTGQLAREANRLLLAADEIVREADQEIAFAEAQYGEEEVRPFRDALAKARDELKEAFAIRQRLDDEPSADPAGREAMLSQVVEHARQAGRLVDEQRERIEALRDLERTAPEALAELDGRLSALEDRLPGVDGTMERLSASYAQAAWTPIAGHLVETRKRLTAAREEAARGHDALARSDSRRAAIAVRNVQAAAAEATALLDAVERLAAQLDEVRDRLAAELPEAERDVRGARAAIDRGAAPAGLAERLDEAERLLASARTAAAAPTPDPLRAFKDATSANALADEVLAGVRAAEEQQARLIASADAALAHARAEVDRAADYIATRRAGVGRRARTRLVEAERHLEAAVDASSKDPASALDEARQADRLAEEAYRIAASEFETWDRGGPGPNRDAGADVAGAILGSIIGGILSGGERGGGWGGTPWGVPGMPRGGGFGGVGGRGRSGGGSFGGFGRGGGRARGGRW
jgi:uncharacterized membrane protein YgcG